MKHNITICTIPNKPQKSTVLHLITYCCDLIRICTLLCIKKGTAFTLIGTLAVFSFASESTLDDPLEVLFPSHKDINQQFQNDSMADSTNKNTQNTQGTNKPKKLNTSNANMQNTDIPYGAITDLGYIKDFAEVQKSFPWIRSVGLAMVSFDDGSFRSGFGILLPDNIFLTSAELGHNAASYPKNILLKMRDKSAGNLICIAQLQLKALDKVQGLALFKVANYTDDYCNIRSQSHYHQKILVHNTYDITKAKPSKTNDFYTVTTTFNNPNISVLKIKDTQKTISLPLQENQKVVFGRPFFSKNGDLLGITTMPHNAIRPIIIGHKEIKGFLCELDKNGFEVSDFVTKICR